MTGFQAERFTQGWVNPFPQMSSIEAMIYLVLRDKKVPFMWRYFDGDSPSIKALMPEFAPEFTLSEYKTVILIIGNFWGTLPGLIDKNALAQALLEHDGWKVLTLYENDIRLNPTKALTDKMPELANPAIQGVEKLNPFGADKLLAERLTKLRLGRRGRAAKKVNSARVSSKPRSARRRRGGGYRTYQVR